MNTSWKRKPVQEHGIICACDANQEWLLPWWWERYRSYNDYPVLFCDYGMTKNAKKWCLERGQLISLSFDEGWIRPKEEVPPSLQREWTKINKNCWSSRSAWFKKPFALLESPFKKNIFLDVDCEVLSQLGELFEYCTSKTPLVISSCSAKVISELFPCEIAHNGGVVVFSHGIDIISHQAEWILKWNTQFFAEDNVLSYLIYKNNCPISDLPIHWNWLAQYGFNFHARIFHWNCSFKNYLRTNGGIKPFRDALQNKMVSDVQSSAQSLAESLGLKV
ncbi:MAG: hypothetical protein K1X28_02665 [Parachlamydiales bacterium]|nr:hypothetical protein [Parachlamydiales bacterium]